MPCSGAVGGSFFVACVRERLDPDFERDDEARERDDDRVLEAMRPRYPRQVTQSRGDTLPLGLGPRRSRGAAIQRCLGD